MNQGLIILVIIGILLPSFSLAQAPPELTLPETLEEAGEIGEKVGKEVQTKLPGILEKTWKEEILPVWQRMWERAKKWWDSSIFPWLQNIWQKILGFFGKEVEKRKPIIKEEFQKEKEELKEEVPKVTKSLWERFLEIIK